MNLAYIRVSTVEQNDARQYEGLKKYGIDKWFTEKISGKDTNRPQLQILLDFAREGEKGAKPKGKKADKTVVETIAVSAVEDTEL